MNARRIVSRVILWTLLVLFAIGAFSMGLTGLARSPAARDFVKHEISALIQRELGVRATFSDVDLLPQAFSVVARGISLDHSRGGRLLDAAELRIRPSFRGLLRGQLDLNVVQVDRATLWLKVRDGEVVNAPQFPESSGETEGLDLDLPLNFLTIHQARIVVDAEPQAQAEVAGIDLWVDATRPGEIGVRLSAGSGFVSHEGDEESLHYARALGRVYPNRIAIEHAELETAELQASVREGRLRLPLLDGGYEGEVDVAVQLAALARLPDGEDLPELGGRARVRGRVTGRGARPRVNAEVVLDQVSIDGFGLGERMVANVAADEKAVRWEAVFHAVDRGGQLSLTGSADLDREGYPMQARGRARGVSFGKLMKQLGVTDNAIVDWVIDGEFELAGPLSPLQLRGEQHFATHAFHITEDAYHQRPNQSILFIEHANLDGGLRITEAGINFTDVDATLGGRSRLEVDDVLLGFDNSLRVRAQGAEVDLRDVGPLVGFELDGQGSFDVAVDGTFDDPKVAGSADFRRFAFAGFPFGDLSTKYRLERDSQAVRFTETEIQKNESRYHTDSLFMDFTGGMLLVESHLNLDRLAVADFYHIFHYEDDARFAAYQGTLAGPLDVRYTLGFPGDNLSGTLRVNMDLQVPEAILDGYRFTDGEFEGSWDWYDHEQGYEGGVLTVERLALHKGHGTASVSGQMRRLGKLNFVVAADRIAIKDTEGLGERVPGLTGTYAVMGTVKGRLSTPRADLDVIGTGLRIHGAPLGESRAYVRMTDKHDPWIAAAREWPQDALPPEDAACAHGRRGLAIGEWAPDPPLMVDGVLTPPLDEPMAWVLCGTMLGGQVEVDLAVGRTEVMPLRGRLSLHEVPWGRFLPRSGNRPVRHGSATGHVDFTDGAALEPATLGGELVLTSLKAGQFAMQVHNNGPIKARFGGGSFTVERAQLRGRASRLRLQGGGSTRHGLSLTVDGNVDLSLLSQVSSRIQGSEGRLDLQFNVAGDLAAPEVYGSAQVKNASLQMDALPTPVSDINGSVVFSEHRVVTEDFRARVAGGQLHLRGAAALAGRGLGSYRLRMEAEGMRYQPREGMELRFGGRTLLAWQEGDRLPKLSGTLRVDRALYSRDIQVSRSLQDIYRKERTEVPSYAPEDDHLAIDLEVVESQPLRIENNLIEAEVDLDTSKQAFRIVGTDQRFGVLGNMSVRRGTLRFRGTTFDIRDGEFQFGDPTRIAPSFDLHAVTDVRRQGGLGQDQWHITLHAWGSRDEFRWELTSDPHLSEDDIALMLTVGMTHAELAQLETGELTSTAAVEALATVTGVEREVKRALPTIDEFRVQSGYSESTNRTEPQLHIGKRIADRLRLTAATGVASRDFRTGVELQVSDHTSVQAVYNNQNAASASQFGDVGVDLKWRLEFD